MDRFAEKFERQVAKTDGCWFWLGGTDRNGYGQIALAGVTIRAYRFAYELYIGEIPEGHELHHICGIRRCVKPDHLEPLTRDDHLALSKSRLHLVPTRGLRYDTFQSPLRTRRMDAGLSRKQLADLSGVGEFTIVNAELGKHRPRDRTLYKLAQALGCQPSEIRDPEPEAVNA